MNAVRPIETISEVVHFEHIRTELAAFKKKNQEVMLELAELTERYNAALDMADKAVRAQKCSCGPFDLFSVVVKWDATKYYEEMGEAFFKKHGGTVQTVTEYKVDKNRVAAAAAANLIPAEVLVEIRKEELRYHKPSAVAIP
jgi:hypothetical protein